MVKHSHTENIDFFFFLTFRGMSEKSYLGHDEVYFSVQVYGFLGPE